MSTLKNTATIRENTVFFQLNNGKTVYHKKTRRLLPGLLFYILMILSLFLSGGLSEPGLGTCFTM
ncbi:hypothetical protein SAMN05192574_104161 [Mucilaginibacter gossypiicola]|uniref:Uncharacterized protein n=1 Tax=Mucilaginibacter gossypiicola TaxID=551995 RepID=A0A1H8JES4_9SPHI|nr:hypothetical protein SAMN05192574_104161 [Mucilaginibacter gossypiicola]